MPFNIIILINLYFSGEIFAYSGLIDWMTLSYIRCAIIIVLAAIIFQFTKFSNAKFNKSIWIGILFMFYMLFHLFMPGNVYTIGRFINSVILNIIVFYISLLYLSYKYPNNYDYFISKVFELNLYLLLIMAVLVFKNDFSFGTRLGEYEGSIFSQSGWSRLGCFLSIFSLINIFEKKRKLINALFLLLGLIIMFWAFSKTQIIAFIGVLIFLLYFKFKFSTKLFLLLIGIIVILYLSFDILLARFDILYDSSSLETFTGRTYIWESTWKMILHNPWGYGYNAAFSLGYIGNSNLIAGQAHNLVLQLLVQIGFVGTFLILLNYILLLIKYSRRLNAQYNPYLMRNYSFLLYMGINGIGVGSFGLFGNFEIIALLFLFASPIFIMKYKKHVGIVRLTNKKK
ncbi:MAG TPA: O-antigen ligase family protein [Candidatus Paceibacterota bacterium]